MDPDIRFLPDLLIEPLAGCGSPNDQVAAELQPGGSPLTAASADSTESTQASNTKSFIFPVPTFFFIQDVQSICFELIQ